MKSFLFSLSLALGLASATPLVINPSVIPENKGMELPIINANAIGIIPNRYIVVYNGTFNHTEIDAKEAIFAASIQKRNINKRSLAGRSLSTTMRSFKLNNWRASALDADDDLIREISNHDEVAYIEADTKVSTNAAVGQINAPPGLKRLSSSKPGASSYIFDDSAGKGITAYVVDTGIRTTHEDFEGRAVFGANFVNKIVSQSSGRLARIGQRHKLTNMPGHR